MRYTHSDQEKNIIIIVEALALVKYNFIYY